MMRATGHVYLVERKRGDQWYVKYRLPDGRQIQRRLGPAWNGKGRPPAGHYTRRMAEEELQAILTDARRGTLGTGRTGATFADAAAEYLRYVEQVRKIDAVTVKDYRGVIDRYLLPAFGEKPLERITPDVIDAYKERLISEGRLSARVIVRHLTVRHGIFKRAGRVWGLERNPASADLVERPRLAYTGEFDTLDRDELEALANAAHDQQDAAAYLTAAYTGPPARRAARAALARHRPGRRAGARPPQLHERPREGAEGQAGTQRADDASGRRHARAAQGSRLPHRRRRPRLLQHGRRSRRRLGAATTLLPGARPSRAAPHPLHDLRHHFGSLAITVLDPYAVQSYMGHQHYSTTQRYLHHKPRPQDALRLQAAADAATVSPDVSRTETDPSELSRTEST